MTLSLFDEPGAPDLQQASPDSIRSAAEKMSTARVRSLAGILLGFTCPGLVSHSITAAKRAHAEQVAAEALAKLQDRRDERVAPLPVNDPCSGRPSDVSTES